MVKNRKIKDAKDLNTNELIYFTGHAKATYMSDGRNVEDAINNISINGGNGAYAEVSHGTSDTTFTLTPNTFHVWDEVTELTLTFGEETTGVANEYLFQFESGTEPTVLTLPTDIVWANDEIPEIESNCVYQISVLKGFATLMKFKKALNLIENKLTVTNGSMTSTFSFEYPVASDVCVGYTDFLGNSDETLFTSGMQSIEIGMALVNESLTIDNIDYIIPESDSIYRYTI